MLDKRELFRDLTTGTLLYVVVMGFFDDYTSLLDISSHSILVLASIVMQLLTLGTLQLKKVVVSRMKGDREKANTVAVGLAIWAIVFFSKFVFLEVIDILFGDNVNFSGIIGLAVVVAATLVVDMLLELVDMSLAKDAVAEG